MLELLKDPDEVLDWWLDYTPRLSNDIIVSIDSITIDPTGELSIVKSEINDSDILDDQGFTIRTAHLIAIWFSGGVNGRAYNVRVVFTTDEGRTYDDDITVICANDSDRQGKIYAPEFLVVRKGGDKHKSKIFTDKENILRFQIFNEGKIYYYITRSTRAIFNLYNSAGEKQTIDSASSSNVTYSVGNGQVEVNLSELEIISGEFYSAELIIYSSIHPGGVCVIDKTLLTLQAV